MRACQGRRIASLTQKVGSLQQEIRELETVLADTDARIDKAGGCQVGRWVVRMAV
jgi:phage host-nuclease inhibitor protein Gam